MKEGMNFTNSRRHQVKKICSNLHADFCRINKVLDFLSRGCRHDGFGSQRIPKDSVWEEVTTGEPQGFRLGTLGEP